MCLRIKSGPHTARKDFYTLKIAENVTLKTTRSYYQGTLQKYNKVYTSSIVPQFLTIEEGLHSIINPKSSDFCLDLLYTQGIILCKIPQGSIYYLGKYGEIVSDTLILLEPLVHASNLLEEKIKPLSKKRALIKAYKIAESYGYNMKAS